MEIPSTTAHKKLTLLGGTHEYRVKQQARAKGHNAWKGDLLPIFPNVKRVVDLQVALVVVVNKQTTKKREFRSQPTQFKLQKVK